MAFRFRAAVAAKATTGEIVIALLPVNRRRPKIIRCSETTALALVESLGSLLDARVSSDDARADPSLPE